jgi:hypothetical protein
LFSQRQSCVPTNLKIHYHSILPLVKVFVSKLQLGQLLPTLIPLSGVGTRCFFIML